MDFELVVVNGTVIDGTGRARFPADIGIADGKIKAVASGVPLVGRRTLDATGLNTWIGVCRTPNTTRSRPPLSSKGSRRS